MSLHHHGHVHGAARCVHKSDIHGVHSTNTIPDLRGPYRGVANKKVQMQIEKCLRQIAEIDSILCMPRRSSPEVVQAEQQLKSARKDLTQELADLRKREYYSSKPARKKTSSLGSKPVQRNLSPATTTSSEKSSSPTNDSFHRSLSSTPSPFTPPRSIVRLANMPLEQYLALDPETATSLPLDLRPAAQSSAVSDKDDQLPLSSESVVVPAELHQQQDEDLLAQYLRPGSPADSVAAPEELQQPEEVSPLEQYLRPSSPADSLARSEDSLAEVEEVAVAPVEDPTERASLVEQYVATADRVRQVYALCMTRIASHDSSFAFVDPAEPLAEEFDSINRGISQRAKEGRDAIEEHVLPHSRSDFNVQKQRYERERRDHARFVQTVLDNLPDTPENGKHREYLTKYLANLSKPLPEDPTVPADVVSSHYRFQAHTLERSADEEALLSQQAQGMSVDALKEAVAEQAAFLKSLDQTVFTLNMDDPHVKGAVSLQLKIGVMPQGYIDQYSRLLRASSSQASNNVALQEYFDALSKATGSYQGMRAKLASRKSDLCRLIEKDVLPHTSDRRAVEEAMNAFHPQSKAVF
jgi:hypothetical protein